MRMKKATMMDDDSYDCGFHDDRDNGADYPDEDVVGTTVATTAGGARVTTHGVLGNVRVTKRLRQGSTQGRSTMRACGMPQLAIRNPRAHVAGAPCSPSNNMPNTCSHAWLEGGVRGQTLFLARPP